MDARLTMSALAHHIVKGGAQSAVTMTLAATKTVADAAASAYAGFADATMAGTAAALPAVVAAASPAVPLPPVRRSAISKRGSGNGHYATVLAPGPASQPATRGADPAWLRARIRRTESTSERRVPEKRAAHDPDCPAGVPRTNGRIAPTSVCQGNADNPATPKVSMVRKGPLSSDMSAYAPASSARPHCSIKAM